jgi:hypothetical protein
VTDEVGFSQCLVYNLVNARSGNVLLELHRTKEMAFALRCITLVLSRHLTNAGVDCSTRWTKISTED